MKTKRVVQSGETGEWFSQYPVHRVAAGQALLAVGEKPEGIYFLVRGVVRQSIFTPRGEVLAVHLFRPGSFFFMPWLVNGGENNFTFEAITNTDVRIAPIGDVLTFFDSHPNEWQYFAKRLLLGVDGLLTRLQFLLTEEADVRVASLLVYLAKKFGEGKNGVVKITIPMAHREIAAWIGTTRETASLAMERLKEEGIISYRKRFITLVNLKKLEDISTL